MSLPTPDTEWFRPSPEIQTLLSGKTVFCSFSGGADSLALLILLRQWSRKCPFVLNAVHFEHGFRGQASLDDAEFCRQTCAKWQIPFQMHPLYVPDRKLPQEGDEEAARRCRLEAWQQIADSQSVIALGHHANDRIENLLLRLFRGSNASGLTSMRSIQILHGLTFIRPLLEVTRTEIEAWLRTHGIAQWCHDSTNDSARYRRNLLRLKLLPQIQDEFPFAIHGLRQSLRVLEEDAFCLEQWAGQTYLQVKKENGLDSKLLAQYPAALQARILRIFLQDVLQIIYVPDANLIARFQDMIRHPRPLSLPLAGQPEKMLYCRHAVIFVGEKENEPGQSIRWSLDKPLRFRHLELYAEWISPAQVSFERGGNSAYFDADQVQLPFSVSDWQHGDRMIPFGRTKEVTLKKLIADASLNTDERKDFPVIRDGSGKILWAAGLRNSAEAPVLPQTVRVLHLFLKTVQR